MKTINGVKEESKFKKYRGKTLIGLKKIFSNNEIGFKELINLKRFIHEFDELYGSFIPREELIERIKKYVEKIKTTEDMPEKDTLGQYFSNDKLIIISSHLKGEDRNSVFFHEMLHAISQTDGIPGFRLKHELNQGSLNLTIFSGSGFDEGCVEYLTQIRGVRFAKKEKTFKSYPVLTSVVTKFAELVGDIDLMETYFNNPTEIDKLLKERLNLDQYDNKALYGNNKVISFLSDFDTIQKYELEIEKRRIEKQQLFDPLMEYDYESEIAHNKLVIAQENILQVYIDTLFEKEQGDFNTVYTQIKDMHDILVKSISIETIKKLIEKFNITSMEQVESMSGEGKYILQMYLKLQEIDKYDNMNKKVESLYKDEDFKLFFESLPIYLREEFSRRMLSKFYDNDIELNNYSTYDIIYGLSPEIIKQIIENGYDLNNLFIDFSDYDTNILVRLYYKMPDGKEKEIELIQKNLWDENTTTLKPISFEEQKALMEKYPIISEEDTLCGDESGNYVIYGVDGEQRFISSGLNDCIDLKSMVTLDSKNQLKIQEKKEKLDYARNRRQKIDVSNAPQEMKDKEDLTIRKLEQEITDLENDCKKVFDSQNNERKSNSIDIKGIEDCTINGDVTEESINNAMNQLIESEKGENEEVK